MKHTIKMLTLPLRLALVILIFGALFKIMHWPYATQLMFIGSISIAILYTIRFFKKHNKSKLDYVKLALVLIWILNYFVKAFHLFYMPYIFEIVLVILFIYWFVVEGISYFNARIMKKNKVLKAVYFSLIALTLLSLFLGIIFKIQHWPYSSILFVSGVFMLNIWLILDYFIVDREGGF